MSVNGHEIKPYQQAMLPEAVEAAVVMGDLSKLSADQCVSYYRAVCDSVGLNPLTKPFEYIILNGKKTLYATRNCTDQLRKVHRVSLKITARDRMGDLYVVTAQASTPDGRCDESTGAVDLKGLSGEKLANALMKAETKAKRRATLSLVGLSLLDETEVETIPTAVKVVEDEPKPIVRTAIAAPLANPWTHKIEGNGTIKIASVGKTLADVGIDTMRKAYRNERTRNGLSEKDKLNIIACMDEDDRERKARVKEAQDQLPLSEDSIPDFTDGDSTNYEEE